MYMYIICTVCTYEASVYTLYICMYILALCMSTGVVAAAVCSGGGSSEGVSAVCSGGGSSEGVSAVCSGGGSSEGVSAVCSGGGSSEGVSGVVAGTKRHREETEGAEVPERGAEEEEDEYGGSTEDMDTDVGWWKILCS